MYLLDTHTLVWGVTAPEQLPARVQEILRAEEVKASVVSYWELMLRKGRSNALVLDPMPWWERYVTRSLVEVLPVRVSHVDRLDTLAEECTLVTADSTLFQYGVRAVWGEAVDRVETRHSSTESRPRIASPGCANLALRPNFAFQQTRASSIARKDTKRNRALAGAFTTVDPGLGASRAGRPSPATSHEPTAVRNEMFAVGGR